MNLKFIRLQIRNLLAKTTTSAFFKKAKGIDSVIIFPKYWKSIKMYFPELVKGEKRACPGVPEYPRTTLVEKLVKEATERTNVCNLFNYGCWCGQRGHGKYVDNFD